MPRGTSFISRTLEATFLKYFRVQYFQTLYIKLYMEHSWEMPRSPIFLGVEVKIIIVKNTLLMKGQKRNNCDLFYVKSDFKGKSL